MSKIDDIIEDFELLDNWDDRYRYLIELGRKLPPFPEDQRNDSTKVQGCASQVWLRPVIADGRFDFQGDSDAMIVRGLVAVLHALYSGLPLAEVGTVDAAAELGRLGLDEHLSSQRSNGLRAMVQRIREEAASRA